MGMAIRINAIFFMLAAASAVVAQPDARVRGQFDADSVAIGKIVPYTLTAAYPRTWQVVFPDSTFSFAPFEITSKKYFPTRTIGDTSYDSVIYFLSTFEIDSVQSLKLPVFVLQEKDCVAVYSIADSVSLRFRVNVALDSIAVDKLPLKISTAYQKVQWIFNYPILAIIVLVLVLLLVGGWLLFGKRIRKYFVVRRLQRNYGEFVERFNRAIDKLGSGFSRRKAEEALILWKQYMEDLEAYPYTKSTSREILRQISNLHLDQALRTIDRGIYGGLDSSIEPFRYLQSYSQQQFQKREAEVKNG